MKTAEEWLEKNGIEKYIGSGEDERPHTLLSLADIQQIQLDAMKEGMRRAAEIVHKDGTVYLHKLMNDTIVPRKQAILSASEQLTIKDLEV